MKTIKPILIFIFLIVIESCGPKSNEGGTTAGNPQRRELTDVTLQSSSYTDPNSTLLAMSAKHQNFSMLRPLSSYELKLCVIGIVLINDNERDEIEVEDIGLVDLSDISQTVTWGTFQAYTNSSFDAFEIIIGEDEDVCGVDYSIRYEGQEINIDFELYFENDEDVVIAAGEYFRLQPQVIVEAIEDGANDGYFNNDDWEDYIDDFYGDFEEDDDEIDDEDVEDD